MSPPNRTSTEKTDYKSKLPTFNDAITYEAFVSAFVTRSMQEACYDRLFTESLEIQRFTGVTVPVE